MKSINSVKVDKDLFTLTDTEAHKKIAQLQQKITSLEKTINTLKSAAFKDVVTSIANPLDDSVPTELAVKNYIDTILKTINIKSFDVVVPADNKLPTASEETMYKIYFISDPKSGSGTYIEYITLFIDNQYIWEQMGYRRFF